MCICYKISAGLPEEISGGAYGLPPPETGYINSVGEMEIPGTAACKLLANYCALTLTLCCRYGDVTICRAKCERKERTGRGELGCC